jgi:hypothetical protein
MEGIPLVGQLFDDLMNETLNDGDTILNPTKGNIGFNQADGLGMAVHKNGVISPPTQSFQA